nr:subtilisin-like protease SBT3.3 [Ipomoea batatas]
MGVSENFETPGELLRKANKGDGIIVGIIDSGITTKDMPSFDDAGFGEVPRRWNGNGVCGSMSMFGFNATGNCNRKVIGARWFFKGAKHTPGLNLNAFLDSDVFSGVDTSGHGSQVASIVAGSYVENATVAGLELDMGVPRGGAPRARLASYKVCWSIDESNQMCSGADILSAFDYAIHDRVDIISVSMGTPVPLASATDADNGMGIGSFHAILKGIPVVVAAGNDGPTAYTVSNVEPWLITVGASTMDRIFAYTVTLGNGEKFVVDSYYPRGVPLSPLYYAGVYTTEAELIDKKFDPAVVKGKIIFMIGNVADEHFILLTKALEAGAAGVIYSNSPSSAPLNVVDIGMPFAQVDFDAGTRIKEYVIHTDFPTAQLWSPKIQIGRAITPKVADFSARGPSSLAPAIMKPDIVAPGDKILCAHPNAESGFTINSGTSHSAPHVSAIVALLKISHPEWSPSALKSALTTTAWNSDTYVSPIFADGSSQKLADAFDYGGGIVNAAGADDPGLVYDMRGLDYAQYLCSLGYNNSIVFKTITGGNHTANEEQTICHSTRPSLLDLNLPSMVVPDLYKPVTLRRTVTNVGPVNSVYKSIIKTPVGVTVTVKPRVLRFDANRKKRTFTMMVSTDTLVNSGFTFGSLTWTDGVHNVRSPIAVKKTVVPVYF